jgi:hypothetical protein
MPPRTMPEEARELWNRSNTAVQAAKSPGHDWGFLLPELWDGVDLAGGAGKWGLPTTWWGFVRGS